MDVTNEKLAKNTFRNMDNSFEMLGPHGIIGIEYWWIGVHRKIREYISKSLKHLFPIFCPKIHWHFLMAKFLKRMCHF